MELRLQKFIESVENLSNIRNLDDFNPIVFQMESPINATKFTVVGAKLEPSYMGIPVNTTWVVLDPTNQYYMQALKLKDTLDPDTVSELPQVSGITAWWHRVRTYDEIFADPQYFVGLKGPKGDRGDIGPEGPAGNPPDTDMIVNAALIRMTQLSGTLEIVGSDTVTSGTISPYQVMLTDIQYNPLTQAFEPKTVDVTGTTQIQLDTASAYAFADMDSANMLHVGQVNSDIPVMLSAVSPSWGLLKRASKSVLLTAAYLESITITGASSVYAGSSITLTATGHYSDGTSATITPSWTVSDESIATIAANGVLTGVNPITADSQVIVSANMGEVSFTHNVNVLKLLATNLVITGASSVNEGASTAFNATVTFNSGAQVTVNPTWSVNNSALGSINSAGLFTASLVAANSNVVIQANFLNAGESVPVTATKTIVIADVATPVYPFFGTGPALPANFDTFVNALPNRGTQGNVNVNMTLDAAGADVYMYFAYPKTYGLAQFFDVASNFYGGWGGAGNSGQGPSTASSTAGDDIPLEVTVTINGVPTAFYVYRSDFDNLGNGYNWVVSPKP